MSRCACGVPGTRCEMPDPRLDVANVTAAKYAAVSRYSAALTAAEGRTTVSGRVDVLLLQRALKSERGEDVLEGEPR